MSSSYKSFAVVGAGVIGLPILNALAAKADVSVILLSRAESTTTRTVPPGVQIEKVDVADAAAVAEVFKKHKVDVVVAATPGAALGAQKPLIDAAKLAEVKLFVPSEYGTPTDNGGPSERITGKTEIAEYAKKVGIPTTRIFAGLFTEYLPMLVGYPDKIHVIGKGEAPVSCTSIADIAGYVAHVLTTLPPSALADKILRIQGVRITLPELAPLFKTTVAYVDKLPGGPRAEFLTHLQKLLNAGFGSTGWDDKNKVEHTGSEAAGSGNALWPGHQWKGIKEVHGL